MEDVLGCLSEAIHGTASTPCISASERLSFRKIARNLNLVCPRQTRQAERSVGIPVWRETGRSSRHRLETSVAAASPVNAVKLMEKHDMSLHESPHERYGLTSGGTAVLDLSFERCGTAFVSYGA